ncbi:tRNA dihydrouridine synthase DusB [Marinibactrum halimedae]|uniref:tRNA-dihydrouridine synthase B n=1 Tax=Marinibactrum halimedae TaxID=1444977 RepID=A0AA37T302_9GAMM|nr:tRNA dihydrouridine synthase DusB [Marinibactrum halimedae]MCD9459936.1 tRNA dihydrouridine synthase DusB [Marinibactrum halimedae]GLS25209.1 tRNA-dihydrouridine synthase B [Marinibactrum halimedae]
MFSIGSYSITNPVILAPMAGVTDRPFRQLCRDMGAGLVVSEMVTADTRLWKSRKSQTRLDHTGEESPRSVQIAGAEPSMMAQAAAENVRRGAQIIDINMGCPAKKVCNKAAGSALLRDEKLVTEILMAVVNAVDVPVTLKIRTGWDQDNRNAVSIARIAEQSGIQALAVHGRTRACKFNGSAEFDTIANVVKSVSIPVFANGDICSPETAKKVLDYTGAAAVMIGRAAQGRPWIFREITHFLRTGTRLPEPDLNEIEAILCNHLSELHRFYGHYMGVRIARKHVGWYLKTLPNGDRFRAKFNELENVEEQHGKVREFFERLKHIGEQVA